MRTPERLIGVIRTLNTNVVKYDHKHTLVNAADYILRNKDVGVDAVNRPWLFIHMDNMVGIINTCPSDSHVVSLATDALEYINTIAAKMTVNKIGTTARRTGKTTADLIKAIELAREGKEVVVVCPTIHHISYSRHLAVSIMNGIHQEFTVTSKDALSLVPGNGKLYFTYCAMDPGSVLRGKRVVLVFDHAWADHISYEQWAEWDRWAKVIKTQNQGS